MQAAAFRIGGPLAVGVALTAIVFEPTLGGLCFLTVPYLVLSLLGRRTRSLPWVGIIAVLITLSLLGFSAGRSSSTGGLIFLWLMPLQCAVASVASFDRLALVDDERLPQER